MSSTREFGFKEITRDNWLTPDPIWEAYWRPEPNRLQGWVDDFLAVQMRSDVPVDIRGLFEVARSAFIYGLMFYPLVTIGAEQICRVSEAAVSLKCKLLNAPNRENTFKKRIGWLIKMEVIKSKDEPRWDYLRFLRNEGSHPKFQTILTPVMCLKIMEGAAELIGDLFTAPQEAGR
ncbi:MAG: hypothetical protein ACLP7O_05765 [Terracidiphilus sp.]